MQLCWQNVTILVYFRENYGFVRFTDRSSAYRAIERANDDPKQPKVDLCFGGRRNFCKEKYSDLGESTLPKLQALLEWQPLRFVTVKQIGAVILVYYMNSALNIFSSEHSSAKY
jgi:hypothetical protein